MRVTTGNEAAIADAWDALRSHQADISVRTIPALFAADKTRFDGFSVAVDDLLVDFSRQRLTHSTLGLLFNLAAATGVAERGAAMFEGKPVNVTEGRAVLHTALRVPAGGEVKLDGVNVATDIHGVLERMARFAEQVRTGELRGATGAQITDIVNIGIGGSDLGPAMVARALAPFVGKGLKGHFVANVDPADLDDTLVGLDPARTLFIVASKTFTTQETLANARVARAWLTAALGEAAVADHFAAVSTNLETVAAFGINAERTFGFWDWVGGRYSVWGAIGLPLMILLGPTHFHAFLDGAHEMDRHFVSAPATRNLPMLLALIGVWNRNILGAASQAVIPYEQRLARLPAYLQQLEMESNGKAVQLDGAPVLAPTCPVVWGEPGTNAQHSFFQLLHQGTDLIPVDILVGASPVAAGANDGRHHARVANALAQARALAFGRDVASTAQGLKRAGLDADDVARLTPHRTFSGNRPSTVIMYRSLDPRTVGRLIALYEHKVFVQGAIWGINSFDQWGVELGKEMANALLPLPDAAVLAAGVDASLDQGTSGLMRHFWALNEEQAQ